MTSALNVAAGAAGPLDLPLRQIQDALHDPLPLIAVACVVRGAAGVASAPSRRVGAIGVVCLWRPW